MTWRVLRGLRDNGTMGFDVSKPGFDVRSATKMQMAFSSDLRVPKVVVQGTIVISPSLGYKAKDNNRPGGNWTVASIPYGRTISPMPVVAAIATAPSWNIPLVTGTSILPLLAGKWHTYVYENFAAPGDTTYGTSVNREIPGSSGDANTVSFRWAACRFYALTLENHLEIQTNCSTNLTVKYLVLEYV